MAATLLSSILQGSRIKITLVESADIATIGVGESTVPSMIDFLHASNINLKELVQATSATFKLGIRFDNWSQADSSFFHPFGKVGRDINGFEFYQAWFKATVNGHPTRWIDHSTSAIMAEQQRFTLRPQQPSSWVLGSYANALHLDAVQLARYLRRICITRGVTRVEGTVSRVNIATNSLIQSLELTDGTTMHSDFFIDCTGFKGLLIEKAQKVGFEDWSQYLPCNRAVTVQTSNTRSPAPFTVATAQKAGWRWAIPLQQRTGNGYVYANQFCSDDEATSTLLNSVRGERLNEPHIIPFVTGKREKLLHKNCLALGLAGGFLEPLESTAIHLIYKTLVHFIKHFPDKDFDADTESRFNQEIDNDYLEIRDFLILHYCTSGRDDSNFWRWCQTMPVPTTLRENLQLFKRRGQLIPRPGQFFTNDSWYSILEGMNIRPQKYHPLLDAFHPQDLMRSLNENVNAIRATVEKLPHHYDYIQTHCPAN